MADRKPVSSIIRRNGAVKHPRIRSFATSLKTVQAMKPVAPRNNIKSEGVDTSISLLYHTKPNIKNLSEVPDLNITAGDDYYSEKSQQQSKAERRSPVTPQEGYLPKVRIHTPIYGFRDSSPQPSLSHECVSAASDTAQTPGDPPPQNLGWGYARSSDASFDVNGNANLETRNTSWHKTDKPMPLLPPHPIVRPNAGQEKKSKHVQSPSIKTTANSRKHSDMEALVKFHKFGKKLQVVYHQGPKGEGQKMWNGIRSMNKEKQEPKQSQASLKEPWAARSPHTQAACAQAQKEQLNNIHAAALHMPRPLPKAPLISPPVPNRPSPLGVVRTPVIPEPLSSSLPSGPWGREGSQGKESTMSTFTYHSVDVPVTAARSVLYDAKESIIDHDRMAKPHVVKLDPAPRPKTLGKKDLPLLPVLRPGEPVPPELARRKEMFKLRVGRSPSPPPRAGVDGLPPASQPPVGLQSSTTASNPQNKHPAGSSSLAVSHEFPYVAAQNPSRFVPLDDRQTKRPRHATADKAPKKSFIDAFSNLLDLSLDHKDTLPNDPFTDLFTQTKEKARAKHQQKLKESISGPCPVVAPGGIAVNFAVEAGGVGGRGAAVAVAPRIPNSAYKEKPKKEAGKLGVSTKLGLRLWDTAGVQDIDARPKGKKDKKAKHPKGSRPDSDASMVCADALLVSQSHHSQDLQSTAEQLSHFATQGKQKADEGPVADLGWRVYRGLERQFPEQQAKEVRDPGPRRQTGEWQKEGVEEDMLPVPLRVRKGTRAKESYHRAAQSFNSEYGDRRDEIQWL